MFFNRCVVLVARRPRGPFFAPAGASFLSARQAPQDRDKSNSGGLGASGNVVLVARRPRGPFFTPAGTSFLSARQAPQDRDKSNSGGLGASGNVVLVARRPRGPFFTPAGTSFLSARQAPQDRDKSNSGGSWAHQENWRERRRASRTGRQDGGQRAVETGMSSPPVPPDEAGVERTAQRQFSAPCGGSWGAGETPPMPFTRRGRDEIERKVGERNSPPYRPFPPFTSLQQYCRGKSSYQRDKS